MKVILSSAGFTTDEIISKCVEMVESSKVTKCSDMAETFLFLLFADILATIGVLGFNEDFSIG